MPASSASVTASILGYFDSRREKRCKSPTCRAETAKTRGACWRFSRLGTRSTASRWSRSTACRRGKSPPCCAGRPSSSPSATRRASGCPESRRWRVVRSWSDSTATAVVSISCPSSPIPSPPPTWSRFPRAAGACARAGAASVGVRQVGVFARGRGRRVARYLERHPRPLIAAALADTEVTKALLGAGPRRTARSPRPS